MKAQKKRSGCPISCSLDIWGDKWSLLIVRDLMFHKTLTYGNFLKSDEGIATNILANRLQILEEKKIIEKIKRPENKVRVWYRLTQKGIDLVPILVEINLWADKYLAIATDKKEMIKKIKRNKPGFIQTAIRGLVENQD